MKIEDTERAKPLFREAPVFFNKQKLIINQSYVIEDQGKISGIASYKLKDSKTATLDCLYVKRSERGSKLGDGLLRAILNHLNIHKVTTVFITGNRIANGFFVAEGLEIVAADPNDSDLLTFRVDLPAFFDRGCKHSEHRA
jgi:N-acetylglutamate synthase-like GNAT family acetyltransferase